MSAKCVVNGEKDFVFFANLTYSLDIQNSCHWVGRSFQVDQLSVRLILDSLPYHFQVCTVNLAMFQVLYLYLLKEMTGSRVEIVVGYNVITFTEKLQDCHDG